MADLMKFPDLKLTDVGGSAVDFSKNLAMGEDSIFRSYADKVAEMPMPLDLYQGLETAAGIPELKKSQSTLQGQVYSLEDSLRRVEPDVTARSGNSMVTEAQRRGMVDAAQKPIVENLGWIGQSLGRVSNAIATEKADIGTKVGLQMEGFKQQLEPYKERLSMVMDQNARTMSGFTADRQATLDIVLSKIERDMEISDMEWQQAQELAKEEREFERSKQTLKMQYDQPDNKVVESNGRQLLVNMKTGQTVADLGSSKSGTGTGSGITIKTTSAKPTSSPKSAAPTSSSYNQGLYNYLFSGTTTAASSAKLK